MSEKMTKSEEIMQRQQLRESHKALIKAINEHNSKEWADLSSKFDAVYVYRSELDSNMFAKNIKIRKVTVVGAVVDNGNGTYNLQIGWSKCHTNDKYNRKIGNLVALKRAASPNKEFEFYGFQTVKPLVIENFSTRFLKENFIKIAALIIDQFEDVVNTETNNIVSACDNFLLRQAGLIDKKEDSKN